MMLSPPLPVLIVTASFYPHLTDALRRGAVAVLQAKNMPYDVLDVPGALEIPAVIALAAQTGRYAGYIALGCVIRGETSHYDIVSQESARALQELAIGQHLAIGNGILTVESEAQALERADPEQLNKGGGAADACLSLLQIRRTLQGA
jgi:6,7-dimethyl-8-ribityllumazine synthase